MANVGNVGITSINNKLVFAMGELTGNLCLTDLGQRSASR
jgi:hypothetical protein